MNTLTTQVLATIKSNPILIADNQAIGLINMISEEIDEELYGVIQHLMEKETFQEKMDIINEHIKDIPASINNDDEFTAMDSIMDIFEDLIDNLPKDTYYNLTDMIENYYHYITNKTLIEEYD